MSARDGALRSSVIGIDEILETGIAERSSEDPRYQRSNASSVWRFCALYESVRSAGSVAIDAGAQLGHYGSPRSRDSIRPPLKRYGFASGQFPAPA